MRILIAALVASIILYFISLIQMQADVKGLNPNQGIAIPPGTKQIIVDYTKEPPSIKFLISSTK